MLYFIFNIVDDDHVKIAEVMMERDLYIPPSDDVKPLPRNNKRQQTAIDKALGSTFTLIQGPPGKISSFLVLLTDFTVMSSKTLTHQENR